MEPLVTAMWQAKTEEVRAQQQAMAGDRGIAGNSLSRTASSDSRFSRRSNPAPRRSGRPFTKTYIPDSKFGVVNDVVRHGELSLVLRRVDRLDLTNEAALQLQFPAMARRDIGQHRHYQWVSRSYLSQTLRKPHHTLNIVTVSGKESHESPSLDHICLRESGNGSSSSGILSAVHVPIRKKSTAAEAPGAHEYKQDLQAFSTSKLYTQAKLSKTLKVKDAASIILDSKFWNNYLLI
ncbi:hypothetical protein M5K25_001537 [Dendrobium thyrsiflorum]|uniref:Uncharacterized protein n=1 Tax=Dendrobium thyrsiflorum TaxID=117978 RepID=A0ABD0W2B4_DENTH